MFVNNISAQHTAVISGSVKKGWHSLQDKYHKSSIIGWNDNELIYQSNIILKSYIYF